MSVNLKQLLFVLVDECLEHLSLLGRHISEFYAKAPGAAPGNLAFESKGFRMVG